MKTLLDLIREPIVIGAFILAGLIVIGCYIGSHWYYGDVELVELPEVSTSALSPPQDQTPSEVDLSGLQAESGPTQTESKLDSTPVAGKSVDDFLAGLSEAEEQLLAAEVVETAPPRESPFGLGPYPKLPSDWPRQDVWDVLEQDYKDGYADIEHELIQRVLIKLWKQGKQTDSAIVEDGKVYPLYTDTIYIRWAESEDEDGTPYRYVSEVLCHQSLAHYDEDIDQGIMPSGIKVIEQDGAGIDPYSFLDLP